jgi:hypothetical protein
MEKALERLVRDRAGGICEYCRRPEKLSGLRFVLDHITAQKHKGLTTADNLALACDFCNLHKGSDIAGLDPSDGALSRLYHPRRDQWSEHFRLDPSAFLVGLTPVGRATIEVLSMNDDRQVAVRRSLINEGLLAPG